MGFLPWDSVQKCIAEKNIYYKVNFEICSKVYKNDSDPEFLAYLCWIEDLEFFFVKP